MVSTRLVRIFFIVNSLKSVTLILSSRANPGYLGDAKCFQYNYGKAIEEGQKADASKVELSKKLVRGEKLRGLTDKWVLRRTKSQLPDKLPVKSKVTFSPWNNIFK